MRLSEVDGKPSGALWDGSDLYLIDVSSQIAAASTTGPQSATPYTLIYRHEDLTWTDARCALAPNEAA